jgi:hypothetical protein
MKQVVPWQVARVISITPSHPSCVDRRSLPSWKTKSQAWVLLDIQPPKLRAIHFCSITPCGHPTHYHPVYSRHVIPVTLAMSSLEGFVFPLCLFFASFILPAFFPVLHLVLWPAVFPLAWEPWHYAVLLAKEHSPPTLASERPLSLSSFLGQRPHLWPLDPGSHTCLWLLSTISFLTSFTVP